MAPLALPVVPEVYWMTARSCTSGRGKRRLSGRCLISFSQLMVPLVPLDKAARFFLSAGTGSPSASCSLFGSALIRFTETTVAGRAYVGSSSRVWIAESRQMATRAPWSSKSRSSSGAVYNGLCSMTTAPSRSTA